MIVGDISVSVSGKNIQTAPSYKSSYKQATVRNPSADFTRLQCWSKQRREWRPSTRTVWLTENWMWIISVVALEENTDAGIKMISSCSDRQLSGFLQQNLYLVVWLLCTLQSLISESTKRRIQAMKKPILGFYIYITTAVAATRPSPLRYQPSPSQDATSPKPAHFRPNHPKACLEISIEMIPNRDFHQALAAQPQALAQSLINSMTLTLIKSETSSGSSGRQL